jgi:hypothetical protein
MREAGLLVDIHPVAAHKAVRVEQSGSWHEIGVVERADSIFTEITSSEKVLAKTVETGLFERISHSTYVRIDYAESVEDWQEYLVRPRTAGWAGDDEELSKALERLDAGEECLRVDTEFRVATYRRV